MWPQEARLPLVNPKGFLSTLERKTTTSPYLPLDTYCQKQKPKKLDLDQYQMCHGGSSHCGAAEMNLTRNHEVAGLIPGFAQWVKYPAFLRTVCRSQMRLRSCVAVAVCGLRQQL